MPVMLWVALWSSMMGAAACWSGAPGAIPAKTPKRRELASGE
ncbi:MAG: hypothetical protein WBF24_08980 [Xanthobacteraceae bacterium]